MKSIFVTFHLVFIILIQSSTSVASAVNIQWSNKWKFDSSCTKSTSRIFKAIVIQGLRLLGQVKSELVLSKYEIAADRNLKIFCEKGNTNAAGEFHRKNKIFGKRKIKIPNVNSYEYKTNEELNVVLHEFFHFLEFDNLPNSSHNDINFLKSKDLNGALGVTKDVVYSCSYLTTSLLGFIGFYQKEFMVDNCQTCLLAIPNRYGTTVLNDPDSVSKIRRACQQVAL